MVTHEYDVRTQWQRWHAAFLGAAERLIPLPVRSEADALLNGRFGGGPAGRCFTETARTLRALRRELPQLLAETFGVPAAAIDAEARRIFGESLDKGCWEAVVDRFTVNGENFENTFVPITRFRPLLGLAPDWYRMRIGRSSASSRLPLPGIETPASNVWFTGLKSGEKWLFRGLRSATIVPLGEPDRGKRLAATSAHAKQLLAAAAAVKLASMDRVERERYLTGSEVLDLHLTAIDLQNPEAGHERFGMEFTAVTEGRAALFSLRGRLAVSLETSDGFEHKVLLNVLVHSINIPTQHLAYREEGVGWSQIEVSLRGIESLLREASAAIADPRISRLRDEISRIVSTEAFRTPVNVYGLPARIAMLASLLGHVVQFNCMSGKDRTGMLDAEIKFLSIQLERGLRGESVSGFGEALLPGEKRLFPMLAMSAGNTQVQRLNTGVPGSKLSPITTDHESDPLVRRVGRCNWPAFKGLAALAEM